MSYTDPEPPDGQTRDEHIAACIGCQHLQRRGHMHLTCYELAARAAYAGRQLSTLFKLYRGPGDENGDYWHGYPPNVPDMVDAVLEHVPAASIDLGRPAIVRWVEPFKPDQWWSEVMGAGIGAYALRCQCQMMPIDIVHTNIEQVASAPCRRCGETTPAVFAP